MLRIIDIPIIFAWLFGIPWFTNRMANHITFQKQTFLVAAKMAFCDMRLRLSFLPIIGPWFEYKSDQKQSDEKAD